MFSASPDHHLWFDSLSLSLSLPLPFSSSLLQLFFFFSYFISFLSFTFSHSFLFSILFLFYFFLPFFLPYLSISQIVARSNPNSFARRPHSLDAHFPFYPSFLCCLYNSFIHFFSGVSCVFQQVVAGYFTICQSLTLGLVDSHHYSPYPFVHYTSCLGQLFLHSLFIHSFLSAFSPFWSLMLFSH